MALVITRYLGDKIVILDDNNEVMVSISPVQIKGYRQVRIAIEAEKSIQIRREEIYLAEKKLEDNRE